jgi:CheY-like chemotaxis protein
MTTRDISLPGSSAAPGNRSRFAFPWSGQNAAVQRKRTVLLVEDEPSIAEPLAEAIGREGFETKVAGTVAESLALAAQIEPDLVLLDVMLPDGSGYDVCRELRRRSQVPIIMLTARGEEADRVVGLELGADAMWSSRLAHAKWSRAFEPCSGAPRPGRVATTPSRSRSGSSSSTQPSAR